MLPPVTADAGLLARLETCHDTAPRATSDTEEHGPLTLFVARVYAGVGFRRVATACIAAAD
jgi:hypothetical protein